MVKISSQAVIELLRYQYLHKPRNNSLCPRGSMGLIMWDIGPIRISLLIVNGNYV